MSERVTIIDYGSGNLRSAEKSTFKAAQTLANAPQIIVTNDPETVLRADRVILPGVGAFADCFAGLGAVSGMREALQKRVINDAVPFLGICVGMQLMAERGLEKGEHEGLGWIKGAVKTLDPDDTSLKIPHMGWNTLEFTCPHPLFAGIQDGPNGLHAYFVHSYHMQVQDPETLMATTNYGGSVTAAIGRDNLFGTQFHPEKSQKLGLTLMANFLNWKP